MFVLRSPGGYFRSNKPVNKKYLQKLGCRGASFGLKHTLRWNTIAFNPNVQTTKEPNQPLLPDSWYHRNRLTRSGFSSVRSKDPWRNRDYALARVSSDGDYLHRAPDDLLRDRELVLRAICSSEGDLRSAKSFFCEVGLCFEWFQKFNGTGTPFDVFDRWGST